MDSHIAVLSELESLVTREREALTQADAALVLELSEAKAEAMSRLMALGVAERADLEDRFERLTKQLRDNLILMVHARTCVTEVLQALAPAPATYHGATTRLPTGARLSVTG